MDNWSMRSDYFKLECLENRSYGYFYPFSDTPHTLTPWPRRTCLCSFNNREPWAARLTFLGIMLLSQMWNYHRNGMAGVTSSQGTSDNSPLMWALLLGGPEVCWSRAGIGIPHHSSSGVDVETGHLRLQVSWWSFSQVIYLVYSRTPTGCKMETVWELLTCFEFPA